MALEEQFGNEIHDEHDERKQRQGVEQCRSDRPRFRAHSVVTSTDHGSRTRSFGPSDFGAELVKSWVMLTNTVPPLVPESVRVSSIVATAMHGFSSANVRQSPLNSSRRA